VQDLDRAEAGGDVLERDHVTFSVPR